MSRPFAHVAVVVGAVVAALGMSACGGDTPAAPGAAAGDQVLKERGKAQIAP
jgi:hypothetical protein